MNGGQVAEDKCLRQGRVVHTLAADEPRLLIQAHERSVCVDLVLPLQLMPVTVVAQVGRGLPRMVPRFPPDVRDLHAPAVKAREHAQVKAQAGPHIRDVRDAYILLGVGPPGRQSQIVGARQPLHPDLLLASRYGARSPCITPSIKACQTLFGVHKA